MTLASAAKDIRIASSVAECRLDQALLPAHSLDRRHLAAAEHLIEHDMGRQLIGLQLHQIKLCRQQPRSASMRSNMLAYPIARGSAPVLVTIGAALFAGEIPGSLSIVGVLIVSAGIVSLAFERA
ncbi:MAG: hypothetical protein ABW048_03395 [Sphingobium sp.]